MRTDYPASARLHRPSEYASALKGRRIARGALFVVNTPRQSSASADSARLGLIIPKRLATRAVTRNTIKRVIREAFRLQRPLLPPNDFVVRLHTKVPDLSLRQLRVLVRTEIDCLFQKAR
ncbi:ribonuclease P protein component [Paenalcaligenes hominis]|uniref:Ribonuclease P protein component n=1 Tax=Paenalcaligenes hominis TaxID=643674 RepID=A0A1U9K0U0_9BURK|nr:ribonuclease P protein component [Paenalcaligenes hominis]AQS51559.1 ribonuclease P protein component [Paenalcaligenes hominis]